MAVRPRREPPAFRCAEVASTHRLTPRLIEVRLRGPELRGLVVDEPAQSIRLLVPRPGGNDLQLPTWNGNEFLDIDGQRPALRTFTPIDADGDAGALTMWIVRHGGGAVSGWAESAGPGDPVAVSGPGRGHVPDASAPLTVLLGDETAIPAIVQLRAALGPDAAVRTVIEVVDDAARLRLPGPEAAPVQWTLNVDREPGATLLAALHAMELPDGVRVWAAGEAAAVQAIRRHLFDERGLPRAAATVRGYWKRRA